MTDIGSLLKEAREASGKSLEDVFGETRIRVEHMRLLESNDFEFLPETYVKSYLKNYGNALGLNGTELVQKWKANKQQKRNEEAAEEQAEEEVIRVKQPVYQEEAPRRQTLEWVLGFGIVILIVTLFLAYGAHKRIVSQLTPVAYESRINPEVSSLADVNVIQPEASAVDALQLEIRARKDIWVQISVDNSDLTEYKLASQQSLVWKAANKFELRFGRMNTAGGEETRELLEGDEELSMTIAKRESAKNQD
jgi:cytoskeletal protein RodZ